jgi:hypothetical protein
MPNWKPFIIDDAPQELKALYQNMANMITPMTRFIIVNAIHDFMNM